VPQIDTKWEPPRATWAHPYKDEKYLSEHPELRRKVGERQIAIGGGMKPCTSNIQAHPHRGESSSQQVGEGALQSSSAPQDVVCHTVKQLAADCSPLVRIMLNLVIVHPGNHLNIFFAGYHRTYRQRPDRTSVSNRCWGRWECFQRHLPSGKLYDQYDAKSKCQPPCLAPCLSYKSLTRHRSSSSVW
jgi:hypothetical protein